MTEPNEVLQFSARDICNFFEEGLDLDGLENALDKAQGDVKTGACKEFRILIIVTQE